MNKNNRVEEIHVATGGHVTSQDAHKRTSPYVKIPQKTNGALPVPEPQEPTGFAKASPTFKESVPSQVVDPKEQEKAIAENTVPKTETK